MTNRSGKIVIGWVPQPFAGISIVQQSFMDSFVSFLQYDSDTANGGRNLFAGYLFASCGYIPASRNMLVRNFLDKSDAEWLLMLDWDITYDPIAVYQLLDAADPVERPIVSGVYVTWFGNDGQLRPCWLEKIGDVDYVPVTNFVTGKVVELSSVGMGFTIMHRDMLLHMEEESTDKVWPWFGHDLINTNRTGEDLTFCNRARTLGYKVWGHGGVMLGHTKAKMLTPLDVFDESISGGWQKTSHLQKQVLNVGGGTKDIPLPSHYQNYEHILLDIKEGPDVDIVCDAKELVNHNHKYDAIFSSHTIEHFEMWDIPVTLRGFLHVLKDGGTLEIHCPNFKEVFERVNSGVGLDEVAYQSSAGPIRYKDVVFGWEKEIEESGLPYYMHKTAITPEYLQLVLEEAGFEEVQVFAQGLDLAALARKPL